MFIDKTHLTGAKFKTKNKVYNDITDWIKRRERIIQQL